MNNRTEEQFEPWNALEDLEEPIQAPAPTADGPLFAIAIAIILVVAG